jgi:beta-phosphoglucomutase family hydrolase
MLEIPPHVRGLIFDCDGTIADTMPLHYQAWLAALQEHSVDFPEAMFYEMAGIPTRRIIEILNEKHGYNLPVDESTDRKENLFIELIPKVSPIEPVVELVKQFHGQLPMAVATGGTRSICHKTLQALGLDGYFQAIVTADDVTHGKPAPDIFLEAARQLDVLPGLCCAFEDGELGIQSARAAGMLVIDIRPAHRASLAMKERS